MTGLKVTTSTGLETVDNDEHCGKIARKYLFAANWLALIIQKSRTGFGDATGIASFIQAFRDLALLCQFFWNCDEFRTGTDGLLYDYIRELYADIFHEAL